MTRPLRPEDLGRLVGDHLARYGTTRAHLRRLLARRIGRSLAEHGGDEAALLAALDAALDAAARAGLLDDRAWAESRARSLTRRGVAPRVARERLRAKGVDGATASAAVAGSAEAPELESALAYARRRRLGRFREPAERAAWREKDLARLVRAGFAWDVARRVVEGEV